MRSSKALFISVLVLFSASAVASAEDGVFTVPEDREKFAADISSLVEKAWKEWQDAVVINGVNVEGSTGVLTPGNIVGPVLSASAILKNLEREGKTQKYIDCLRVVAKAVEEGMRSWQRGYRHGNIPFPQGASCVYTLPPCNNVPVTISSGESGGDSAMTEKALYNHMRYNSDREEEGELIVFRACAKAIGEAFEKWKGTCSIIGILASGGIAPQPSPMGSGPGPVTAAKGSGGKFVGAYLDGEKLRMDILKYITEAGSGK